MLRVTRDKTILKMSPDNPPVSFIESGDIVVFETLDCFSNKITREDQLFSSVGWEHINPATGPLFVKDAEAGDILRVEIIDIILDSQGVMVAAPGFGVLGDIITKEETKIIPIVDGKAVFNEKIKLALDPMIGVIGTAPQTEDVPTGTPGEHGGNMDCKRIRKGSIVYLPVNVPGALLAMGDLHAVMGDGEIVVCGVEISGEVVVKVDVIRRASLPLPMVVHDDKIMTIASAPTLDEAARNATKKMFTFLHQEVGINLTEASMLLSVVGNLHICQIVDPLMTARMEFPLWILDKYNYKMKLV